MICVFYCIKVQNYPLRLNIPILKYILNVFVMIGVEV